MVRTVILTVLVFCAGHACSRRPEKESSSRNPAGSPGNAVIAEKSGLTAGAVPDTAVLHPLRVGGDVKPPVALERVEPGLPKKLAVAGMVVLELVIDKRGMVRDVRVLRDAGEPAAGAVYAAAMKKWRFRPATLHGQPVDVTYNFTVNIDVR